MNSKLSLVVDNTPVCEDIDLSVPFVSESMLERTPVPVLYVLARALGIEPCSWEHSDLVFLVERAIARGSCTKEDD